MGCVHAPAVEGVSWDTEVAAPPLSSLNAWCRKAQGIFASHRQGLIRTEGGMDRGGKRGRMGEGSGDQRALPQTLQTQDMDTGTGTGMDKTQKQQRRLALHLNRQQRAG